jgi:hypothetical protein
MVESRQDAGLSHAQVGGGVDKFIACNLPNERNPAILHRKPQNSARNNIPLRQTAHYRGHHCKAADSIVGVRHFHREWLRIKAAL